MESNAFLSLAVSLGLGLLVGFQREWASPQLAGLRTFALITVLGTLAALLSPELGTWTVPAGLLAIAAMVIAGSFVKFSDCDTEPGLTTQAAAMVMYLVGAAVVLVSIEVAVAVGGAVAVLLHWKEPLHAFVDRIGKSDIRAIIQLVLIALVILPVLPDETYGPYNVLNPFRIWLMVVLICGISVGGYTAAKFFGSRAGTLVGGILGGIISSTATTVSYARRSREAPQTAPLAATVILIASTIVFGRVLFEVAIVSPQIVSSLSPPLAAMTGLMAIIAAGAYQAGRKGHPEIPLDEDPSELKTAIAFGALYALVLLAVAAAREHFGDRGLYVVAALSGLTDMDAITLSTAQLISAERLTVDTGWRMILLGALSNMVFKGLMVASLGHPRLLWRIALAFGIAFAGGVVILLYWPAVK